MPNTIRHPMAAHRLARGLAAATAVGLFLTTAATAQDGQKHLTLNGIMSGTTAPQGLAFASLSGTTDALSNGRTDGSLAFGMGFGNAEEKVGVQLSATLTSLTADSGGFGFGDSGYLTLKFSKRLGSRPVYLGLQIDKLAPWGAAAEETYTEDEVCEGEGGCEGPVTLTRSVDPSVKLALTWFSGVSAGNRDFPLIMTLGVGNKVRNFEQDPGVFAGVGVGLSQTTSASFAWSGDYFDLGLGLKMADSFYLNATVNDVFDQKDSQRLTLTFSYTFNSFGG